MGKFNKNNKKRFRYQPSARKQEGEAVQKQKKPEPPVVKKLKSAKADDRKDGCMAVASMATEHDQLVQLVEHNVALHVGRLLTDEDEQVAAVAAGALKNMLISADTYNEDVFGHMLGPANVMILLDSVCNTLDARWNQSGSEKKFLDMASEMLQFLALLLTKDQACASFLEDPKRVDFLMSSLSKPNPVPFYAAHCLLILSEENGDWQTRADSFGLLTQYLREPSPLPLRVTCAGMLLLQLC